MESIRMESRERKNVRIKCLKSKRIKKSIQLKSIRIKKGVQMKSIRMKSI